MLKVGKFKRGKKMGKGLINTSLHYNLSSVSASKGVQPLDTLNDLFPRSKKISNSRGWRKGEWEHAHSLRQEERRQGTSYRGLWDTGA